MKAGGFFLYIHSDYRSGKFTSGWDVFIVVYVLIEEADENSRMTKSRVYRKELFSKCKV